jgi:hypothetical protein
VVLVGGHEHLVFDGVAGDDEVRGLQRARGGAGDVGDGAGLAQACRVVQLGVDPQVTALMRQRRRLRHQWAPYLEPVSMSTVNGAPLSVLHIELALLGICAHVGRVYMFVR